MYNGEEIENHSFLPFFAMNGGITIACVSDNPKCCTEDNANWFLPGSTTALTTTSSPYSVARNTNNLRNVALIREWSAGNDQHDDDGLYHCEIIGTDGSIHKLYVWLDSDVGGKL